MIRFVALLGLLLAAGQAQAQSRFGDVRIYETGLPLSGGTVSGNINLGGNKITLDVDANSYLWSGGGDDNFNITLGGTSRLSLSTSVLSLANTTIELRLAGGAQFSWASRSQIYSPADGSLLLLNAAGTGFTQLAFGGTTASFPSLTRSGTVLQCTLADLSGTCQINAVRFLGGASSPTSAFAVSNGGNYGAASGSQYGFTSSATDGTTTLDTGITRASAGMVKITNGSSGDGKLAAPGEVQDVGTTCAKGEVMIDTGGATVEICVCTATDTIRCVATTTSGPAN